MSDGNRSDQAPGAPVSGKNSGRFQKGQTGNPKGRPKREDAVAGVFRSDGWTSLLTGLGTLSRDKRESMYYQPDLIDWETALNIYRGDPFAARIIETKPNELVREGYDLCITDSSDDTEESDTDPDGADKVPARVTREVEQQRKLFGGRKTDSLMKVGKDLAEDVENKWEELELLPTIHEALCYEAAYGGAAILIGARDGATSLEDPLVMERVRGVDFLTALEPREITPVAWYGNPHAPKYGKPAIYQLTPSIPGSSVDRKAVAGTVRIHESRLIVFSGARVTRRNLSQLGGWGDSVLTRIYRVLRDFNMSWGAAGVLVADFAQAVYKMKGLNELLQEDPKDLFKSRMLGMELSRSVARAVMIDGDDEFERKQTPVSGLPELLDRFATQLAAAGDIPLPLLFGESPGGLNASGASGDQVRSFYDKIASMAKRKVCPAIRRITAMIFQGMGGEPETWSIKPRALWQLTEKEQAETRKIQMDTDAGYMDRGVLEASEVRESRFGGDGYSSETSLRPEAEVVEPSSAAMAEYAAEQTAPPAKPGLPNPGSAEPKLGTAAEQVEPGAPMTGPAAGGREIAKEAMNGAQISSLLEVIKAAGDKAISRESAGAVLRLAFQINEGDATALLGPETFVPTKPPAPVFGGGGAPFGKKPADAEPVEKVGEKPEPEKAVEPEKVEPPKPEAK